MTAQVHEAISALASCSRLLGGPLGPGSGQIKGSPRKRRPDQKSDQKVLMPKKARATWVNGKQEGFFEKYHKYSMVKSPNVE